IRIPISAKNRLGFSTTNEAGTIAQTIQDNCASLIAVHGRTAKQRYTGEADWRFISEIKAKLSIPVLGNGDVDSYSTAKRRMNESGVDGVLIGRAAQGNPWVFNQNDRLPSVASVFRVIETHVKRMVEFHGEIQGLLRFRKHALSYLRRLDVNREIGATLIDKTNLNQFLTQLDGIAHIFLDDSIRL
ncbi:MAG: tRNA-dihydrouridine synthase, partial [Leptonema sp. (in: Bacteria)]|nr:tRNA-dihydrouridine synthase [Leptonema sp. (in: bacteria)]